MSKKLLLTIGAVASIFCIACNPAPEEEPVLPEAEVAYVVPFSINGTDQSLPDSCSVVRFKLSDAQEVVSVKLQASSSFISGKFIYFPSRDQMALSEGHDFVICNLTESHSSSFEVSLPVCPGDYDGQLEAVLCDKSHRVMRVPLQLSELKSGQVYETPLAFKPDTDVLFYDGFDLCVWGGNPYSVITTAAYVPAAENSDTEADPAIGGYDAADKKVSKDKAGTGYIQSGALATASKSSLSDFHAVSDSYIASRNFSDYGLMYKCQEYQGLLGVGVGAAEFGVIQTPSFVNITSQHSKVQFSFVVYFPANYNATKGLRIRVLNGGNIESVTLDGEDLGGKAANDSGYSDYLIAAKTVQANLDRQVLVSMCINKPSATTCVRLSPETETDGATKGFYIDEFTLRTL